MEKNTDYHKMSARSISKDVARRRSLLAEKLRVKKLTKRKRLQQKQKRSQGIRVVSETSLQPSPSMEESEVKLVVLGDAEETQAAPSKRKRKRNTERDNRIWRTFNRFGVDGTDRNEAFAKYYAKQLAPLLNTEEEWSDFIRSLSTDLPVTFRLNSLNNPVAAASIGLRLQGEFQFKGSFVRSQDKVISGKVVERLKWFGEELSLWQVNTSRAGFAKCEVLRPLYDVITREAKLGNLARQECASMLPALALKVRGNHAVLDLCASPGSKTEHVLELMKKDPGANGVVVANDADEKRLKHMDRRFAHAGDTKLVITCCGGEKFAQALASVDPSNTCERFDRVICDVPCSGDGTLRKMPYLWRRWRPSRAVDLYPLQLQLLKNAGAVLKKGGRLVYSTCSLNPVENEAVVTAFLRAAAGAFRLVSADLPQGFKLRPGLTTWHTDGSLLPKRNQGMKQPIPCPLEREAKSLQLGLCCRVLPQDNDTGGFFLAVFEKTRSWTMKPEDEDRESSAFQVAEKVLREAGYTVDRKQGTSRSSKESLHLEKLDLQGKAAVEKSMLMDANSVVLRAGKHPHEERVDVLGLTPAAGMAVKMWCSGLRVLSAGIRVGNFDASGRFSPSPFGICRVAGALQGGQFHVGLDDFRALLNMINEVATATTEDEAILFAVDWLVDICESSQATHMVEGIKVLDVENLFAVCCNVNLTKIISAEAKQAQPEATHRRLSKSERKRLKKRRKLPQESKNDNNARGTSQAEQVAASSGIVRVVLRKENLDQVRVISPIDILQSIDEALSI